MPFSYKQAKDRGTIGKFVESDYLEKIEFSDYVAPIVPVLKKNNSISICDGF